MPTPAKNTVCLWCNGDAEEAAKFYAKTFPDSSVDSVDYAPSDYPSGKQGSVIVVHFAVMGVRCIGLNGGPGVKHSEAFSFQVSTLDQAETDRYWNAIVANGGQERDCGWCVDKWGIRWQITPTVLMDSLADPDRAAAKRVFEAMMTMKKIDVAKIEAARREKSDVPFSSLGEDRSGESGKRVMSPFLLLPATAWAIHSTASAVHAIEDAADSVA